MADYYFDPLRHPRNRLGRFRKTLMKMKPQDSVRLPGNVTVRKVRQPARYEGAAPVFKYRIESPMAKGMGNLPVEAPTVEKAARAALNRQAMTPAKGTIGGEKATSYSAFRADEVKARASNPAWSRLAPDDDDDEDILARPLDGDQEANYERLDALRDELRNDLDRHDDEIGWAQDRGTGVYYSKGGSVSEDAYMERQELLERVEAAIARIENEGGDDYEPPALSPEHEAEYRSIEGLMHDWSPEELRDMDRQIETGDRVEHEEGGFGTVIEVDADGEPDGETGYMRSWVTGYVVDRDGKTETWRPRDVLRVPSSGRSPWTGELPPSK